MGRGAKPTTTDKTKGETPKRKTPKRKTTLSYLSETPGISDEDRLAIIKFWERRLKAKAKARAD